MLYIGVRSENDGLARQGGEPVGLVAEVADQGLGVLPPGVEHPGDRPEEVGLLGLPGRRARYSSIGGIAHSLCRAEGGSGAAPSCGVGRSGRSDRKRAILARRVLPTLPIPREGLAWGSYRPTAPPGFGPGGEETPEGIAPVLPGPAFGPRQ